MDGSIDLVTDAATEAQELVYQAILDAINQFEIADGRYVVTQNYSRRIAILEKKIKGILGDIYAPSITEYLSSFTTVEETNIALQKDYNQLEIDTKLLTPAKTAIYTQAEYYLKAGLADAYIQPAKYLLMQQISTGISIKDSQRILKKWNDGDLTGKLTSGRQTPNLQKYATQVSRNVLYQYHGTINELIANEYDLKGGIYTGDIIEDSRPGCKYLVGLKRIIHIDEIPGVIKRFPEGVIAGTTKENFPVYRMGHSCRHSWFAVRWEES